VKRYAVMVDGAGLPGDKYDQALSVYTRPQQHANVILRCDDIVAAVGRPLRPEEEDWLDLLQAIHVADLVCRRGRNEEWNRHIVLSLPVRRSDHFEAHVPLIREVFGRLTQDQLDIHLETLVDPPPAHFPSRSRAPEIDAVALLSGGIDSAAAAVGVLEDHTQPCFVSHRSAPHVIHAQKAVTNALAGWSGRTFTTAGFHVDVKRNRPEAPLPGADLSQRSRTLLFAGVAALIAAARGIRTVTLGENGVMAINCPLTAGRVAGFSTHTAHPGVLTRMATLFSAVLGAPVEVLNPLLRKTKTEVVEDLVAAGLGGLLPVTHSCWVARSADHCGTCVPCIVRRFAAEAASAPDAVYTSDVFANPNPSADDKFANLGDYLMFATSIDQRSDDDLLLEFDELNVEGGETTRKPLLAMHRRWANDVLGVARRYPALAALL
jgi:7-cyano-7-deazaguanine synthase in queuosine biosynthesis